MHISVKCTKSAIKPKSDGLNVNFYRFCWKERRVLSRARKSGTLPSEHKYETGYYIFHYVIVFPESFSVNMWQLREYIC